MIWYYLGRNVLSNKLFWQSLAHPLHGKAMILRGKAKVFMLATCFAHSCSWLTLRTALSPIQPLLSHLG